MKLIILAVLTTGCTDTATIDFAAAQPGIYTTTVRADDQTCMWSGVPAQYPTAPFPSAAYVTAHGVNLAFADGTIAGTVLQRRILTPPGFDESHTIPFPCGSLTRTAAITELTAATIRGAQSETWTLSCATAGTPDRTCDDTSVQTFELVTPCAAPCTIRYDGLAVTCQC